MISKRVLVPAALMAGMVVGGVTVAGATAPTPIWLCTPTSQGQTATSGGAGVLPACASGNTVGIGFTYVTSDNFGHHGGYLDNIDTYVDSAPGTGLTVQSPTDDGVDIAGPTGTGLAVSGSAGPGVAVSGSGGTGVSVQQHGGTGLAVTNSSGTALSVSGVTKFSRSGLATIGAHKRSVDVSGIELNSTSMVFATLQSAQGGVSIEGVTKHSSSLKITLTKPSSASIKVAWFVVG